MKQLTFSKAGLRDPKMGAWEDDGSAYVIVSDDLGNAHTFHFMPINDRWLVREMIGTPVDLFGYIRQELATIRIQRAASRGDALTVATAWACEHQPKLLTC